MMIEGAVIWGALGLLAVIAVYMVVERCLMCVQIRAAEPTEFERWHHQFAKGRGGLSRMRDSGLSWLNKAIPTDGNDRDAFRGCHRVRQDVERYDTFLLMIPNAAQMLGLLGTAAGLAKCKLGVADPYSTIGLAIETTKCGLMIAIPMVVVIAVLSKRNQAILDQIESVLHTLDDEGDGSSHSNGVGSPDQPSRHCETSPHDISDTPRVVHSRSNNHPIAVAHDHVRGLPVVPLADDQFERAIDEVLLDGGRIEKANDEHAITVHHGNGRPK